MATRYVYQSKNTEPSHLVSAGCHPCFCFSVQNGWSYHVYEGIRNKEYKALVFFITSKPVNVYSAVHILGVAAKQTQQKRILPLSKENVHLFFTAPKIYQLLLFSKIRGICPVPLINIKTLASILLLATDS